MMLRDMLAKAGDFCFDHRGLQFLPYLLIILVEFQDLQRVHESIPFELFCFAITFLGVVIRIMTIGFVPEGTSGRNRGAQIAEALNTKGMYSIVRNPLYVGNFFIFLGITVMTESWEIIVANSLLMLIIYVLIILREEEFLSNKFGDEYKQWAQKINCLIPSFKHYEKTDRKFSIKKVIKNEHDTWLTAILAFVGIEIIRGYFEAHTFFLVDLWVWVLAMTLIIWIVSKVMKKSQLLN